MFIDRRSHKKNGDQALQNNAKSKKKSGEVLGSEKRRQKEHISMKTYNALPDQIITASKDGQDVTFDTNSVCFNNVWSSVFYSKFDSHDSVLPLCTRTIQFLN